MRQTLSGGERKRETMLGLYDGRQILVHFQEIPGIDQLDPLAVAPVCNNAQIVLCYNTHAAAANADARMFTLTHLF